MTNKEDTKKTDLVIKSIKAISCENLNMLCMTRYSMPNIFAHRLNYYMDAAKSFAISPSLTIHEWYYLIILYSTVSLQWSKGFEKCLNTDFVSNIKNLEFSDPEYQDYPEHKHMAKIAKKMSIAERFFVVELAISYGLVCGSAKQDLKDQSSFQDWLTQHGAIVS